MRTYIHKHIDSYIQIGQNQPKPCGEEWTTHTLFVRIDAMHTHTQTNKQTNKLVKKKNSLFVKGACIYTNEQTSRSKPAEAVPRGVDNMGLGIQCYIHTHKQANKQTNKQTSRSKPAETVPRGVGDTGLGIPVPRNHLHASIVFKLVI